MREPVFEKGYPSYEAVNDIYDTADIIKQDTAWLARLRTVANEFDDYELRQIADRFESLTTTAHNRKHWTGHE